MSETERPHIDSRDDLLWHYTDANGFLGILGTKHIFATHALFMNDRLEITKGYQLLRDLLERRGTEAEELAFNETVINGREPYSVSFTEAPDMVAQWAMYAGAGGVCLGFDKESLGMILNADLHQVIYEEMDQRALLDEALDAGGQQAAIQKVPLLKDPGFSGEKEWRLLYDPGDYETWRGVKMRAGRQGLSPYREVCLRQRASDLPYNPRYGSGRTARPDMETLPLVEVICAPTDDWRAQFAAQRVCNIHQVFPRDVRMSERTLRL